MSKIKHGGDVYRNKVRLDFSTNIFFQGVPEEVKSGLYQCVELCSLYPDIEYSRLRKAIAEMEGCPPEWVLCGNGASELFPAIAHAVSPTRTLIPVPSFYGYERAALAAGGEIQFWELKQEESFCLTEQFCDSLTGDVGLVFLANPNNPVGCRVEQEVLEPVVKRCQKQGITVVVDECFFDFMQNRRAASMVKEAGQYDCLVVVRAFTKSYAIPGVRLGYLICSNEELRKKIALQLAEWNVSIFAQVAGIVACHDQEYRKRLWEETAKERTFLVRGFSDLKDRGWSDLRIYPAEANFLMLYTKVPLYEVLLREGILVRDCSDFRGLEAGYYRIAVRSHSENMELLRILEMILTLLRHDVSRPSSR